MPVTMPQPDSAVITRRVEIVAALKRIVPGEGVIDFGTGYAALRKRRSHRLSGASDGGRTARDHRTGLRGARLLPPRGHQGGAARGRDLAVWRSVAARRRRSSRHGQVQSRPRHRFRQSRRRGRAWRHQSCGFASRRERRLLLRARPVIADRLHHRRQRGGEFGRRALPEIRCHHQQRARLRAGFDDRRNLAAGRQPSRRPRLRSPRHRHRLGGAAWRRYRSHSPASQEAGIGAGRAHWF